MVNLHLQQNVIGSHVKKHWFLTRELGRHWTTDPNVPDKFSCLDQIWIFPFEKFPPPKIMVYYSAVRSPLDVCHLNFRLEKEHLGTAKMTAPISIKICQQQQQQQHQHHSPHHPNGCCISTGPLTSRLPHRDHLLLLPPTSITAHVLSLSRVQLSNLNVAGARAALFSCHNK